MTYGSGGKEAREGQREEITSIVAQQPGGWTKASFPFHVLLCHYEVTGTLKDTPSMCMYLYIVSSARPRPVLIIILLVKRGWDTSGAQGQC